MGLKLAQCAAAVLPLLALAALAAPTSAKLVVRVSESGNATVSLVVTCEGAGSFSTYLPRFERWSYTVAGGELLGVEPHPSSYYFYDNVTFAYRAEGGSLSINFTYRFPFAALYSEGRGWFMSPLVGLSPPAGIDVLVEIRNLDTVIAVTVNGAVVTYVREGKELRIPIPAATVASSGGLRVTVDFRPERVKEEVFTEEAGNVSVRLRAPSFYRGLARTIARVVEKALPRLREVFGYRPVSLEFKLFLPSMMDLRALGYVLGEDINAGNEGPVYLNLALVRFKEGYFETTIVHELVHKALGALGVPASAELRWFHEGVAQYASLEICGKIGINVSDLRADLEAAARPYREGLRKPGFVSRWSPAGDEGSYYAASYYIVSSLCGRYGGLDYLKRVAEEIQRRGGVRTNSELVEALSAAAGTDLAPQFRAWGFELADEVIRVPVPRWLAAAAALALLAATAVSLAVILRRQRQPRCPYCYAVVPRGAAYCPYCGHPLISAASSSSWL